jgi:hypothetical protein
MVGHQDQLPASRQSATEALIRTVTFLRHVPPRRIARRFWLEAKRRALVAVHRKWPRSSAASARLRSGSFEPLFPPPAARVETTPDGYVFSFLGRSIAKGRIIDWATPAGADGDQLWRMNLHYMEYLGGVEDGSFIDLIEQWIAANPPYRPGYWRDAWNAYALSIRATVWMEEFVCRRARLPAAFADRLLASLVEQLAFLISNVETDIGGNHLVKNIRALATAGRVLSGPPADIAMQTALRLLPSLLDEQILSDGMHFERSPSYHNQVFADLLAVRNALSDDITRRLDVALASMAQVTADLVHPDGHVALFGDAGLHMAADADGLLAVYASMFGTRPSPRRQFAFPSAGYFGFRDAGTCLVLDCGRLGPDALMAHAHGDALSFELSAAGERIIVDQGVFEYAAGKRRIASRAVRSHNTVAMGDLEQGDFFDSFRCGVRPNVELIDHAELPSGVRLEGRHDGFARTGKGPVHRRRFTFASGRLDIHDWLEGPLPAQASSALLLHPDCHVTEDRGALLVTRGSARLRIDGSLPFALTPAVYWPDMGVEEKTTRITFHWPSGTSEARTWIEILA